MLIGCVKIYRKETETALHKVFVPVLRKSKSVAFLDYHVLLNSSEARKLVNFDCAVDLSHKPVACKETD